MMHDGESPEKREAFNQSNDGYTSASVIAIRLDTAPMLDQIEAFLRGQRIIGYEERVDGTVVPRFGAIGLPKMNDQGVQSIMSWLTPLFSPHTVQGNFKEEQYNVFICEKEIDLRNMVMINLHKWDVKIEDYNTIIDMIMLTSQAFFSRLIDNKERESYGQSLKTSETVKPFNNGGFSLNPFKRG